MAMQQETTYDQAHPSGAMADYDSAAAGSVGYDSAGRTGNVAYDASSAADVSHRFPSQKK